MTESGDIHVHPKGGFIASACLMLASVFTVACSTPAPGRFHTPEQAVDAVYDLIGSGDEKKAEEIFGPGCMDMFRSGDDVADHDDSQRVKELIDEGVRFEFIDDSSVVALLGDDEWPFAIPLVLEGTDWRFDTEAGRQELFNRRIGKAEIFTIATLHAFVDAQREYYSQGRDGNPPAYATKLMSDEGKHDGLYWPTAEGEPDSPMGALVADAGDDGYTIKQGERAPYHGYYYRILFSGGKNAPGGEGSYLDPATKLMTGGFAAIAWPAKAGNSGIMTFQVNELGIVYQKDLGADTEKIVAGIMAFDPDDSWEPTAD